MKLNPIQKKNAGGNLGDPYEFAPKNKRPSLKAVALKHSAAKSASSKSNFEGGAPEMKNLEQLKSDDPTAIYCIGDNINILKFEIGYMNWFKTPVSNDKKTVESFDGTLRYSSSAYCPCADPKILTTGGCYVINGFPSNTVCQFSMKALALPVRKKPMILKRYGHISVYLNGFVYCIGGFSHKDLPNE